MSEEPTIPQHVALILDGNRRWARQHSLSVITGHKTGADHLEALLERLRDRGVKTTTLWVFSTENWKRDEEQVAGIMKIARDFIIKFRDRVMKDEIRVIHLGRKDRIPEDLRQTIIDIEEDTKNFSRTYLNIALDYGGRDEMLRAVARIQEAGVLTLTLIPMISHTLSLI
jgi:undecaprenyl diphosphate synthase